MIWICPSLRASLIKLIETRVQDQELDTRVPRSRPRQPWPEITLGLIFFGPAFLKLFISQLIQQYGHDFSVNNKMNVCPIETWTSGNVSVATKVSNVAYLKFAPGKRSLKWRL